MKRVTIAFGAMILCLSALTPPSAASDDDVRRCTAEGIAVVPDLKRPVVGYDAIQMPVGYLLLVRHGTEYGAVQFQSAKKWPKGSTGGQGCAEIETWFQGDGSGDFRRATVEQRSERVAVLKSIGV